MFIGHLALAWGAQASWLLPIWAWWGDRHRVPDARSDR
jgi:hypothetical protein